MGSIRTRKETNTLYLDFRYQGVRCREQTALTDSITNRRRLKRVLKNMEREMRAGTFSYRHYFPHSKRADIFEPPVSTTPPPTGDELASAARAVTQNGDTSATCSVLLAGTPLFTAFSDQWYSEREIDWKRSNQIKVSDILRKHLIPRFKGRRVGDITKTDILSLRTHLAKDYRGGKELSPARINQILNILHQILEEAADRFDFSTPYRGIKPLRVPRTQVDPFSLDEVKRFLDAVPANYRNYFTVAFFTGMRTSELIGLKWRYVDFERNEIEVKETLVQGHPDTPKCEGSERVIDMSTVVTQALRDQHKKADDRSEYVFCGRNGQPLNYRNISSRVWYPTLTKVDLRRRRPYQTRHTAATLWLASGESPEWIARQMGHTTTKMLFTGYSRYVPNLTRQDGSAMERLLRAQFAESGGKHVTE